jgi:hypothetical protein
MFLFKRLDIGGAVLIDELVGERSSHERGELTLANPFPDCRGKGAGHASRNGFRRPLEWAEGVHMCGIHSLFWRTFFHESIIIQNIICDKPGVFRCSSRGLKKALRQPHMDAEIGLSLRHRRHHAIQFAFANGLAQSQSLTSIEKRLAVHDFQRGRAPLRTLSFAFARCLTSVSSRAAASGISIVKGIPNSANSLSTNANCTEGLPCSTSWTNCLLNPAVAAKSSMRTPLARRTERIRRPSSPAEGTYARAFAVSPLAAIRCLSPGGFEFLKSRALVGGENCDDIAAQAVAVF